MFSFVSNDIPALVVLNFGVSRSWNMEPCRVRSPKMGVVEEVLDQVQQLKAGFDCCSPKPRVGGVKSK